MPEVHQYPLDPADGASGARLERLLSAELEQERTTARRRRWMAVVAATSVPVGVGAAVPHLITGSVRQAALALWASALLGTGAWLIEEWRGHRRLRALLSAPARLSGAGRGSTG